MVKHVHYTKVEEELPSEEGAKDITVRWLISKKDGAETFAMRLFEMKPGGHSPLHQHHWEHEVFILEGNGVLYDKTKGESLNAGDVVFIPSMEWHQFANTGSKLLKFLCLIPIKEKKG